MRGRHRNGTRSPPGDAQNAALTIALPLARPVVHALILKIESALCSAGFVGGACVYVDARDAQIEDAGDLALLAGLAWPLVWTLEEDNAREYLTAVVLIG